MTHLPPVVHSTPIVDTANETHEAIMIHDLPVVPHKGLDKA